MQEAVCYIQLFVCSVTTCENNAPTNFFSGSRGSLHSTSTVPAIAPTPHRSLFCSSSDPHSTPESSSFTSSFFTFFGLPRPLLGLSFSTSSAPGPFCSPFLRFFGVFAAAPASAYHPIPIKDFFALLILSHAPLYLVLRTMARVLQSTLFCCQSWELEGRGKLWRYLRLARD